tara:strand:- start:384 stop:842 length:459 start_codon:yes stop_codon:yes gene_type:complete
MASTRMRVNTSAQVFHRVAAADDMPAHDVGTSDSNVSGLGGSGDFELESDTNVSYSTSHQVVDTTEAAIGSGAIDDFIYIKNTGYTSSDKSTAVATDSYITIGVGGTFANGGFTLSAGEAIFLHGLGGGSNNLSEFQIDSSVAATYVEIVYL